MFEEKDRGALSSIIERHARLLALVGEDTGVRSLVLPTSEFFPDRFTGDRASADRLVKRMMLHAGLEDVPLTTRVVDTEAESPHEGGCASGCAVPLESGAGVPRLLDDGDGFVLNVPSPELGHPVVLTTMVARVLGQVFLLETLPPGSVVESELVADHAAVALGFGPLLLEGAYIYSSGCGGPRVAKVTEAGVEELSVLTALFATMHGHDCRRATKHLGATQSDALARALEWARSNPRLCERLKRSPERVAAGDYTLEAAKPWLLRLFSKKKSADETDDVPADLFATKSVPPRPRDAASVELSSLVDEALEAARADAE
ncbi:MAG TPA: hypothetical protein VH062_11435 [Polyangiaceae bacterium]|jgi:hypothetical protein|nr:hypothetical protein [Polyangiaceae bacterium]